MPRKQHRRDYDASARKEAAAHTRSQVLDAATKLFLREGYAATTVAKIAKTARVSVETIYKAFGGKPGLVRAMWERALAGAESVPAPRRSDELQARATDPRSLLRAWSRLSAEVAPLASPILLLIRDAAAHDPEMAELRAEADRARLARMADNARTLEKFDVDPARARDVLWLATSPELYELVVLRRGWSVDRYSQLLHQLMVGALL
ncbi:MAG: helix-turn-helix domain-containing protein [Kofleriaceae bacterium]